ncbi:glycosyltransferase family 39 protein [Halothiobacillus sp. DCM-1]|uniref:glycosyltransferase family 39 protein n=1 Tax=Halothiobacillus sp. DCM-1 TaxID=3112558 RepID=UPI0032561188
MFSVKASRPAVWVMGLLGLNALIWVLLPWLTNHSLPMDAVEQVNWGRTWQWGYYKHPFLPAWLAQLFFTAFGDFGLYLLSQCAILVTLGFVYLLGRGLLGRERAAVGILLTLGIYYFIWPTPEWNNNIAQMPFWAAAMYFFWRALDSSRYADWALTGLALGLGLLSKYSTIILIAVFFLYLLFEPAHRAKWRSPALWFGVLVGFGVFLPNLLWLFQHEFLPLRYAFDRSAQSTWTGWLWSLEPLRFVLVQTIDVLPVGLLLLGAGLLQRRYWQRVPQMIRETTGPRWDRRFLWVMALGPVLLTEFGALLLGAGLKDMWGTPMLNLVGIFLAAFLLPLDPPAWQRLCRVVGVWIAVLALGGWANAALLPSMTKKPAKTQWPQQAMTAEFNAIWQAQVPDRPLRLIAGDYWLAGLIAVDSPAVPRLLIDGDWVISSWLNPADLARDGALLVWQGQPAQEPPALRALGNNTASGTQVFAWPGGTKGALTVSWAVIPPASSGLITP